MALLITVEARLIGKLRHILSTLVCNGNFLLKKQTNPTLVHSPQKSNSALHGFEFINDCASFCSHLKVNLMAQSYISVCTVLSIHKSAFFVFSPASFYTYIVTSILITNVLSPLCISTLSYTFPNSFNGCLIVC